jgi:hypothetical protein
MKKDNFNKFQENIDNCLRIKFNIMFFIYYIHQYCIGLADNNLFDNSYVRQIINDICGIYHLLIQKLSGNEILLQNLLEIDKDLDKFLKDQGFHRSILKSRSSYYYNINEISDLDSNQFDKDEILEMLKEDVEELASEISLIKDFKKKITNQIAKLSFCFYCGQKGEINFGIHKCNKCNKSVCEDHFIAENKCNICFKKEILENKKKI